MASDFVPLAPKRTELDADPTFRVKVVSSPGASSAAPAFAPLPIPAPCAHPHSAHPAQPPADPVLTVQREGNRVTGIRIQCGCGQVIELTCLY